MRFKPILFNTDMVQAIIKWRKTQTRRIVKGMALNCLEHDMYSPEFVASSDLDLCDFGKVGDILWVRETFQKHCTEMETTSDWAPISFKETGQYVYKADGYILPKDSLSFSKWRPNIHMPKDACRIFLKVKSLRVERLQDISEEDAVNEGIERMPTVHWWKNYINKPLVGTSNAQHSFETLWQSINGKQLWDDNPFVWVIEFERVVLNSSELNQFLNQ